MDVIERPPLEILFTNLIIAKTLPTAISTYSTKGILLSNMAPKSMIELCKETQKDGKVSINY
jgi:hypothetical protein